MALLGSAVVRSQAEKLDRSKSRDVKVLAVGKEAQEPCKLKPKANAGQTGGAMQARFAENLALVNKQMCRYCLLLHGKSKSRMSMRAGSKN